MEDRNFYAILHQGVEVWNDWRVKNCEEIPSLTGLDLSGKKLTGMNLREVDLSRADLSETQNTEGQNLSVARLQSSKPGATWGGSILSRQRL